MSKCYFTGCRCLGRRCCQYGEEEETACAWNDGSGPVIEKKLDELLGTLNSDIDELLDELDKNKNGGNENE